MIARVLPLLLLLAAAPAPETDPFLAALAGKSGPDAVAAPSFDPDVEACSWTTRPRREIVDALAARLLRGEAKGWYEPAKEVPAIPAPPSRIPADFEPGKFEIADRLAARVPADAAVVFFESLEAAETAVDELAKFLPKALPTVFADAPGGRRDALALAVDELLLPTIWRSNPGVRRGTRQAALLASDPDLRWAPEIALVVEVEDASLVRFHRLSTLSFENRGAKRLRVDGLDATSDDGSVRSFFGLEGGIAVWSTGKAFRDRILAAAAGRAPTLLSPDPRAYALARATFPAKVPGPLLVIPDGFLERANSAAVRDRRVWALRCDALRLVEWCRAFSKTRAMARIRLECPIGKEAITVSANQAGAECSIHGTTRHPIPVGDLPEAPAVAGPLKGDVISGGIVPIAAAWLRGKLEVLVPSGRAGRDLLEVVRPSQSESWTAEWEDALSSRLNHLRESGVPEGEVPGAYRRVFGVLPESNAHRALVWRTGRAEWEGECHEEVLSGFEKLPLWGDLGRVLRIGDPRLGGGGRNGACTFSLWTLPLEWR